MPVTRTDAGSTSGRTRQTDDGAQEHTGTPHTNHIRTHTHTFYGRQEYIRSDGLGPESKREFTHGSKEAVD